MHIDDIRSIASVTANKIDESTTKSIANFTRKPEDNNSKEISSAIYGGDFLSNLKNPGYNKETINEDTIADKLAKEGSSFSDAENMKQKLSMAVAGFTVEDLDEMQKDGYDPKEMEPNELISVLDKIKMHLAMGGKDISMMGGLSKDEISAISEGSVSVEATIANALETADLPSDETTIKEIEGALNKVDEIGGVFEGGKIPENAMEFLLRSNAEPTIENIYAAAFSGSNNSKSNNTLSAADIEEMMPQIESIVEEANLSFDNDQKGNAIWMLENEIPLTKENVGYLNEMQKIELDLTREAALSNITVSLAEGKSAADAYLISGYSLKDRAFAVKDVIDNVTENQVRETIASGKELTSENLKAAIDREDNSVKSEFTFSSEMNAEEVHAMRVLEETRMYMTWQANLTLMKRGVSVDTTDLSELVEKLKSLENDFYKNTLFEEGSTISSQELSFRIETYETTNETVTEIKQMPAVLLGRIPDISAAGLKDIEQAGNSLQKIFQNANERYETMETEVRRDLGDSIKKAFRNIDDILSELEIEQTETNRRAVRILAYNETEINAENILKMKESDAQVSKVLKDMTPPVVAKMIKENINPLDLNIEELEEKISEIKAVSSSDEAENNFAKFLFKAEKASEITDEEREAYIGICRLIFQVEKTDGAVIGHLLNQGSDITLRNMMMAVRTRKAENREFTIDDNFGFAEFNKSTLSITEQIEMSFHTKRMKDAGELLTPQKLSQFEDENSYLDLNPDSFAEALANMEETFAEEDAVKAYNRQMRDDIETALRSEQRVYDILEQYDIDATPSNLESMAQMLADRNAIYINLFRMNKSSSRQIFDDLDEGARSGETDLSDVIEDVMRRFGESVKTPEEMAEAQRNLEDIAENVMKTMIVEERVGSIDVRGMQVSMKQIRTMGEMGKRQETYAIPIVVEDSVGNLTLKIVRGREEERGQVDLALDMESTGQMRASFRYDTDGVYGTVSASLNDTARKIKEITEQLQQSIAEESGIETRIKVQFDRRVDANTVFDEKYDFERATDSERPQIQTQVLYGIARAFINEIGKAFASGV